MTVAAACKQHTPAPANRMQFQISLPTPVLPNPPRCIRFGASILCPRKDKLKAWAVQKSICSAQGQSPLSPKSRSLEEEGAASSLLQLQPLLTASDAVSG